MLSCTKFLQSCLTLGNPMDYSPLGSSVLGDSPGKNTGVGCPVLLQGNLPYPGIEPASHMSPSLAGGFFTTNTTWEVPSFLSKSTIFLGSTKEASTILWGVDKSNMFRTKKSGLLSNVHSQPPPCVWTSCSERDTEKLELFIRVKIQYDRKKMTKT